MGEKPTRERMIVTTAKLLQRQGYFGTGLNQIVAESHAPKGSLYFHFPGGKDELVVEAINASGDRVDSLLAGFERQTTRETVEAYLDALTDHLVNSNFEKGCPIATVALEVAPTNQAIGEACGAAYAKLRTRLQGLLVADGYDEAVASDKASVIYSAILGALLQAKASRSREPVDRLRDHLSDLL